MKKPLSLFIIGAMAWMIVFWAQGGLNLMTNPIFPGAGAPPQSPRFGKPVTVDTGGGPPLYILTNPNPEKARAAALYFHGNGEVVEDLEYLVPLFHRAGFDLYLVEYPGYGHASGAPSEASLYETGLRAHDWTRKERPSLPLWAVGWSLGSSVAAYVASERPVARLLMMSGMTSMKEVVRHLMPGVPSFLLKGNEFETTRFLSKVKSPVILMHGKNDDLVPYSMALTLKDLCDRQGLSAKLITIQSAAHNDFFSKASNEILTVLKESP